MLLQAGGYETHQAYDGLEAIEAAARLRPDAVLLDIGLPKLNGYEVCRRIREQPWGKDLLLVALTGWGTEEDRNRIQGGRFQRPPGQARGLRRPHTGACLSARPNRRSGGQLTAVVAYRNPAAHPIPVLPPSHGRVSGIDWDRRRGSSALDHWVRVSLSTVRSSAIAASAISTDGASGAAATTAPSSKSPSMTRCGPSVTPWIGSTPNCASSAAHERVPAKAIVGTSAAQVPVELSPIQEVGEGQLREGRQAAVSIPPSSVDRLRQPPSSGKRCSRPRATVRTLPTEDRIINLALHTITSVSVTLLDYPDQLLATRRVR